MLVLKVKFGSQIRRLTFPDGVKWEAVRTQICTALRLSSLDRYRVLYEDDEKDRVIITHDADFQEALHVVGEASMSSSSLSSASSSSPASLKVFVVPRSARRKQSKTLPPPRSASASSLLATSSPSSTTPPHRGRRPAHSASRAVRRPRSVQPSPSSVVATSPASSSLASSPVPRRQVPDGCGTDFSDFTLGLESIESTTGASHEFKNDITEPDTYDDVEALRSLGSDEEKSSRVAVCPTSKNPLSMPQDGSSSLLNNSNVPTRPLSSPSSSPVGTYLDAFLRFNSNKDCRAEERDFMDDLNFDFFGGGQTSYSDVLAGPLNQQMASLSVGSLSSTPQDQSASVPQQALSTTMIDTSAQDLIARIAAESVGNLPLDANRNSKSPKSYQNKASQTDISDLQAELLVDNEQKNAAQREPMSDKFSQDLCGLCSSVTEHVLLELQTHMLSGDSVSEQKMDVDKVTTLVTQGVVRELTSRNLVERLAMSPASSGESKACESEPPLSSDTIESPQATPTITLRSNEVGSVSVLEAQSRVQEQLLMSHRALEESMLQLTQKMNGLHERVDALPVDRLRVLNHSFSEGITEGENSQHLSESSTSFSNEVPQLGETPLCAPDENSSSSSCYAGVDTGHGGGGGADDMSSTHGDGSSESAHSPSSVAAACVSEALVSQEGGSVFSQVAPKSRTNSEDSTSTSYEEGGAKERRSSLTSSSASATTSPTSAEVSSEIASAQSPASFVAEFQSALSSQSKTNADASVSVDVCLSSNSNGDGNVGVNRKSSDTDAIESALAHILGSKTDVIESELRSLRGAELDVRPLETSFESKVADSDMSQAQQKSDETEMLASVALESECGDRVSDSSTSNAVAAADEHAAAASASASGDESSEGEAVGAMFRSVHDLMTNEHNDPDLQQKIDYLAQRFGNRVFCSVILNQSKGNVAEAEESLRAFYKK